ncbi:Mur ligase family protein [Hymenobacter sp. J193]|uniref:Mur ligase family protein n=1 Tax=Hymenobacter sp. J193 TaxID=2898429 RepID=UPI0027E2243E|nr:Mur ligase family protein [Hymenobacter sp. J193]
MAATPSSLQRLHLIATGGSIMHNLALALHQRGAHVTGSDDEIFEPAKSRLAKAGLLPAAEGWFPEKITADLDAVIVGMHARPDNPELLRAQELGLRVYSFPEFIYEASRDKQRIVIGGSHGKTSITSLILHVLRYHGRQFDYAVGAQLEGFELMVQLTEDAPIIIIEGDEYLSSPIDRRPKFHLYQHHIGVISGISWDHINVFPTEEVYREQFRIFAEMTPKAGVLIYDQHDEQVQLVTVPSSPDVKYIGYGPHEHVIRDGKTFLLNKKDEEVPVQVFGEHNLRNISAAKEVCKQLGIKGKEFYEALASFKGAARRLEKGARRRGLGGVQRLCPCAQQAESHGRRLQEAVPAAQVGGLPGAAHVQLAQPRLPAPVRPYLRRARRGRGILQPPRAGAQAPAGFAARSRAAGLPAPRPARVHR